MRNTIAATTTAINMGRGVAARTVAALLLTGTLCAGAAQATTLYDPALGTLPSAQSWTPLVQGAAPVQSVSAGSYRLDTTGAGVSYFGNAMVSPVPLNTATGFDLRFSLRLLSETHTDNNRAGYALVVIGADPRQSLELDFWAGNVWAQNYDATLADPFVHGLDASFNTTVQHDYLLSVRNQQYTLQADGTVLLTGALHDYTGAGLPYTQPNLVFFGDDSSRGTSVSQLGLVGVTAVPEPATALLLALGVLGLATLRRKPVSATA